MNSFRDTLWSEHPDHARRLAETILWGRNRWYEAATYLKWVAIVSIPVSYYLALPKVFYGSLLTIVVVAIFRRLFRQTMLKRAEVDLHSHHTVVSFLDDYYFQECEDACDDKADQLVIPDTDDLSPWRVLH